MPLPLFYANAYANANACAYAYADAYANAYAYANALFCLEQLAWSACQMHLIYSTEHKPTDGSKKLIGSFPESPLLLAADKVMHYPKREAIPLPPYSSLSTDDIDSLVSWVIAPTKRV